MYLWILGQADVSWSDKPGGRRTHFEYEIYLKDCMTMWGKGISHHIENLSNVTFVMFAIALFQFSLFLIYYIVKVKGLI